MFCDLHLHSRFSDGTETPTEVVRLAREARLVAIALTDHDTFDGVPEALEAGRRQGIRVVPGVELSLPHDGGFHLIALGVDPEHAGIRDVAKRLCDARGPRNAGMIAKLNDLGIDITIDEVRAEAGGDVIARPHIARVLVRTGVAKHTQDAFDRFLGRGAAAYVDRERVPFDDAARETHAAGGVTILCHPQTLGFDTRSNPAEAHRLRDWLVDLRERGLDAMETRYGSWSQRQERQWEAVAQDVGLLRSGGSDFHGGNKPGLRVGIGRGRLRVPVSWLDTLMERAESRRPGPSSAS